MVGFLFLSDFLIPDFIPFYALAPYLLELYGGPNAFAVAGMAAAIVAGAQILGGILVPHPRKLFRSRTSMMMVVALALSTVGLAPIGFTNTFWIALVGISIWGLVFSVNTPVRSAYVTGLIQSQHRATVLSFDALMGSGRRGRNPAAARPIRRRVRLGNGVPLHGRRPDACAAVRLVGEAGAGLL